MIARRSIPAFPCLWLGKRSFRNVNQSPYSESIQLCGVEVDDMSRAELRLAWRERGILGVLDELLTEFLRGFKLLFMLTFGKFQI